MLCVVLSGDKYYSSAKKVVSFCRVESNMKYVWLILHRVLSGSNEDAGGTDQSGALTDFFICLYI